MRTLLSTVLLAGCIPAFASAASTALRVNVRVQLPTSVATLGQAAAYYVDAIGYRFYTRTPYTGDARSLLSKPVRALRSNGVASIESAVLALIPNDYCLFVDSATQAVAVAICEGEGNRVQEVSLFAPPPALAMPVPANETTLVDGSTSEHGTSIPSAGIQASELQSEAPRLPDRQERAPPADTVSPPDGAATSEAVVADASRLSEASRALGATPKFELYSGELLRSALTRWCETQGYSLSWNARFDIPVAANAVLSDTDLRSAITTSLRPLWGTRHALIAREGTDKHIVIQELRP